MGKTEKIGAETKGRPFLDVKAEGVGMTGWKADDAKKEVTVFLSRNKGGVPEDGQPGLWFVLPPKEAVSETGRKIIPLDMRGDTGCEVEFGVSPDGQGQVWHVHAVWCANPVLAGQYADPDLALFGDTYYLYATTDGFSGWSGTQFHVFSSKNLVDFTDGGIILDVAGDDVLWAVGSAWAPCIKERNGKYYFYFCAKDAAGDSNIGVAVAAHPAGPFTAEKEPLITRRMCAERGIAMGQTIDPSVFTDEDGTAYLLFGNGNAAVVRLGEDMVSLDWPTLANYEGAKDFREAITVTKRGGVYHFTWSCDDTGSPDYHVNYGTSDSIYGPITYCYTLLEKDEENGILGTGHHCILSVPGRDEYYIAYHRFYTPLGTFTEGLGFHREVCIDALHFDPGTGRMLPVKPTGEGVAARKV